VVSRCASIDELEVLAPVPKPGRFVIVGLNYRSHVDEFSEAAGLTPSYEIEEPFIFECPGTAVCAPGGEIVLPSESTQVDYEGEVAVVIGREADHVSEEGAWAHVAGVTAVNDVSARDLQTKAMFGEWQGTVGSAKGFPTFKPLGPALRTADEIDSGFDLGITTTVNGELRQNGRTSEFLTPIDRLISFISQQMVLQPGDVICTGSPRGVGMFLGGIWLRPGDLVEIEVEGVGALRNTVR